MNFRKWPDWYHHWVTKRNLISHIKRDFFLAWYLVLSLPRMLGGNWFEVCCWCSTTKCFKLFLNISPLAVIHYKECSTLYIQQGSSWTGALEGNRENSSLGEPGNCSVPGRIFSLPRWHMQGLYLWDTGRQMGEVLKEKTLQAESFVLLILTFVDTEELSSSKWELCESGRVRGMKKCVRIPCK